MAEQRTHNRGSRSRPTQAGFSLIEAMVVAAILAIGALSLSAVQVQSMSLTRSSRETSAARQAARLAFERIHEVPVAYAFASFNDDKSDDPGGVGTAPGASFTIDTDAGPMNCRIDFPTVSGTVREDVVLPRFGMPRDLNGDGAIDSRDHAKDYLVLPVRVRITWSGAKGAREFDVHAMLLRE
jgi:prepilin-type N-terminal cleavage/methylation domain-containing protein